MAPRFGWLCHAGRARVAAWSAGADDGAMASSVARLEDVRPSSERRAEQVRRSRHLDRRSVGDEVAEDSEERSRLLSAL